MSIMDEYTEYQKLSSFYKHVGEDNAPELTYLALGLAGESGEFADNVKKIVREVGQLDTHMYHYRMGNDCARDDLIDELGDVLWYVNKLCTFLRFPLEDLMIKNTVKLHDRHGERMRLDWPFKDITYEEATHREEEIPF